MRRAQALQAAGVCLFKVEVAECRTGTGGHSVLRLSRRAGLPLPSHVIRPGDIVSVRKMDAPVGSESGVRAVVRHVREHGISVVVTSRARRGAARASAGDADEEEEGVSGIRRGLLRVDRVANDVTYRRYAAALKDLARGVEPHTRCGQLMEV